MPKIGTNKLKGAIIGKIIKSLNIAFFMFFLIFGQYSAQPARAWDFWENSGLKETAQEMGYDADEDVLFEEKIGKIVGYLMTFLGVIFLCLMLYGGWIWMNSRGRENEVQKAKNIIASAIIGLAIVVMSYAITIFVSEVFIKK